MLLALPLCSILHYIFVAARKEQRTGTIACSVDAIRPSRELEDEAEADIVIAVVRPVVVAVRSAAVLRFVEVTAAAQDAVRALWRLTHLNVRGQKGYFSDHFLSK